MEKVYLSQLLKNITVPQNDTVVSSVVVDSRKVEKDSIFLAIKGERVNGEDYAAKAVESGRGEEISCQGVFVSIGRLPNSALVQGQLDLEDGYIPTDELNQTQIPGVFAVGDVRSTPLRQVVTAVADGALAVHGAEICLSGQNN